MAGPPSYPDTSSNNQESVYRPPRGARALRPRAGFGVLCLYAAAALAAAFVLIGRRDA
jgi:hypothetical protein